MAVALVRGEEEWYPRSASPDGGPDRRKKARVAPVAATQYATYFDRHYLSRGLAMIDSLGRFAPGAPIWVLCLDDETYRVLEALDLPDVWPVHIDDFERRDRDLLAVRPTRSKVEYYFTLTAPFLLDVFDRAAGAQRLVYVDADHYFFDSPAPLTGALAEHSIVMLDHRYPPYLADKYAYGRYNVGLLGFRRNAVARECLAWWRERCLEWCYDRLDGDRYADQKYLDAWPTLFDGVRPLDHPGVGLAPWNVQGTRVRFEDDRVTVDDQPLVAYHFSGFRILAGWLFDSGTRVYGFEPDAALKNGVYAPYARAIRRAERAIRAADGGIPIADNIRDERVASLPSWVGALRARVHVALAALRRRSLLVVTEQFAF